MPDISLNLPASTSNAASTSGPVGEIRGLAGDANAEIGGEAAASFASLFKDRLTAAQNGEEPAALLASLLTGVTGDSDEEVTTDLLPADDSAFDPLAAGLLLPTTLPIADLLKRGADTPRATADAASDPITGTLPGNARNPGATVDPAAIAGMLAEDAGKNLPDLDITREQMGDMLADTAQATLQQAHQADFRAHMSAAHQARNELAVATPVNQPGWAEDVGHQITWLADQGISKAELVLTPPHLGRIEISIEVGSDLSSAQFVSASPQVREALEQAMPKLREMLAQGGISLGEANVSSDQPSRDGQGGHQQGQRSRDTAEAAPSASARRGVGLVDLFA
ncbi:flagellar hook-length control protein FliK [Methyloversatilis thermotolerans]|uniref:flagellar hook-length control protein FliK n=1 Tax=Methyloversatilis thermotolerans TaxID=1346290 RepID=UPI00036767E9|nr:flagellar hook-length control protein FliK [Methyloversatilis thermotolerans]